MLQGTFLWYILWMLEKFRDEKAQDTWNGVQKKKPAKRAGETGSVEPGTRGKQDGKMCTLTRLQTWPQGAPTDHHPPAASWQPAECQHHRSQTHSVNGCFAKDTKPADVVFVAKLARSPVIANHRCGSRYRGEDVLSFCRANLWACPDTASKEWER